MTRKRAGCAFPPFGALEAASSTIFKCASPIGRSLSRRRIARSRSVPGAAIEATRLARALGSLELLHPIPRGRQPDAPVASLGPIPARSGSTPDQLALHRPGGGHLLTAYGLRGAELSERVPVVSLLVPRVDLDEIHSVAFLRGRQSERAAYLGLFEGGELLLSTGVGVRIHGGMTRTRSSWLSYRLTARRSYGKPTFSQTVFPENARFFARHS